MGFIVLFRYHPSTNNEYIKDFVYIITHLLIL